MALGDFPAWTTGTYTFTRVHHGERRRRLPRAGMTQVGAPSARRRRGQRTASRWPTSVLGHHRAPRAATSVNAPGLIRRSSSTFRSPPTFWWYLVVRLHLHAPYPADAYRGRGARRLLRVRLCGAVDDHLSRAPSDRFRARSHHFGHDRRKLMTTPAVACRQYPRSLVRFPISVRNVMPDTCNMARLTARTALETAWLHEPEHAVSATPPRGPAGSLDPAGRPLLSSLGLDAGPSCSGSSCRYSTQMREGQTT